MPANKYGSKYFEYCITFSKSIASNSIKKNDEVSKTLVCDVFNAPYVTNGSPKFDTFPYVKIKKKIIHGIAAYSSANNFLV